MADTASSRWWIPGPEGPPAPDLAAFLGPIADNIHRFAGRQFRIPINRRSAEECAWRDAVAWLEARKAAQEEWPWPTR